MKFLLVLSATLLSVSFSNAQNYQSPSSYDQQNYSNPNSYDQQDYQRPSSYDQPRQGTYGQTSTDTYDSSESTVKVSSNSELGRFLTDSKGMTLYMFTPDKNNTSTCYDQCAVTWPPYLISSSQPTAAPNLRGSLGVTKRRDGKLQVTYDGMPLYYYVKDLKPGDTYGQDVDKEWYVVNPEAGPTKTTQPTNSQSQY